MEQRAWSREHRAESIGHGAEGESATPNFEGLKIV